MSIKKITNFLKNKILLDYVYNIVGFAIYIFCQQFIIFPFIGKDISVANKLGTYLTLLAIINIFSSGFGSSLGDVRVLSENEDNNSFGFKFIISLLTFFSCIIIFLISFFIFSLSFLDATLIAMWGILSIYRNYITSEYVKYKKFNYILVLMIMYSIGTLLGIVLNIYLINSFAIIFLSAEIIAFIFNYNKSVFLKEKIISKKLSKHNSKVFIELSLSTFFNYLTNSIDKFIIPIILGPVVLANYYCIAISSKLLGMLTSPLSAVILGWSKSLSSLITKNKMKKIIANLLLLFLIIFILSLLLTPVLVQILYPAYVSYVPYFLFIVSFNGALLVIADLIQPLFIRIIGTTLLSYINFSRLVLYLSIGLLITKVFGIMGFAYFMGILELLTNCTKIIIVYINVKRRKSNDIE